MLRPVTPVLQADGVLSVEGRQLGLALPVLRLSSLSTLSDGTSVIQIVAFKSRSETRFDINQVLTCEGEHHDGRSGEKGDEAHAEEDLPLEVSKLSEILENVVIVHDRALRPAGLVHLRSGDRVSGMEFSSGLRSSGQSWTEALSVEN